MNVNNFLFIATTLDNENNKSSLGVNRILITIAAIGTRDGFTAGNREKKQFINQMFQAI